MPMRSRYRTLQFRMPVRDPSIQYERFPEEWPSRASGRRSAAPPPQTQPAVEDSASEYAPETQVDRSPSEITTPSQSEGETERLLGLTKRKRARRRTRRELEADESDVGMLPLTVESKKIHESGNYYHGPAPREKHRRRGRPKKDTFPELEESPYFLTQKDVERLSARSRNRGRTRRMRGKSRSQRTTQGEIISSPNWPLDSERGSKGRRQCRRQSLPRVIPATDSSGSLSSVQSGPPKKLVKTALRPSNSIVQSTTGPQMIKLGEPIELDVQVRSSISPSPAPPAFKLGASGFLKNEILDSDTSQAESGVEVHDSIGSKPTPQQKEHPIRDHGGLENTIIVKDSFISTGTLHEGEPESKPSPIATSTLTSKCISFEPTATSKRQRSTAGGPSAQPSITNSLFGLKSQKSQPTADTPKSSSTLRSMTQLASSNSKPETSGLMQYPSFTIPQTPQRRSASTAEGGRRVFPQSFSEQRSPPQWQQPQRSQQRDQPEQFVFTIDGSTTSEETNREKGGSFWTHKSV